MQTINLPQLAKGELNAGLIMENGVASYWLILLAGDKDDGNWQDAMDWAKEQGGELPNRIEQAMLFAVFKDQFKEDWYWSSAAHASDEGYAWCQSFSNGSQNCTRKSSNLIRARAIRRVAISAE